MLLDLVIWTSALALMPLLLGVLECWLLGGFAPAPEKHAGGSIITVPIGCRLRFSTSPPSVNSQSMVSLAEGSPCLCLYCSLAGLTEVVYGGYTEASAN